jgi:hypothetical protein
MLVTQSTVGPPGIVIVNELFRRLDIHIDPSTETSLNSPSTDGADTAKADTVPV